MCVGMGNPVWERKPQTPTNPRLCCKAVAVISAVTVYVVRTAVCVCFVTDVQAPALLWQLQHVCRNPAEATYLV